MRASSAATKAAPKPAIKQRALVVGVSTYPSPLNNLPGVANDVAAVAKLLSSKNGTFRSTGVMLLKESAANRKDILTALRRVFSGAKTDDTVFVYFAGHGAVEKGSYYFIAQDTDTLRLAETGVPLAEVKRLFDGTRSKRVFVWLVCCHSGGILPRASTVEADKRVIRREIGVLQGEGKIIIAACAPSQFAYEDPSIGHGLFTHALLRGLKGEAKGAYGEVTAASLYDFIDHEVKHPNQQPVFAGKMAGRIVLMHYPSPGGAAPATAKATGSAAPTRQTSAGKISSSGKLLLIDNRIYTSRTAAERNDSSWEIEVVARNAEEEASLRSLRSDRYGRGKAVSFAFGNQAFQAEVTDVTFTTTSASAVCALSLKPGTAEQSFMFEMGYNGLTSDQLAEMRARFVLLGEQPTARDTASNSFQRSHILGPLEDMGITSNVLSSMKKDWKGTPTDFLRHARLRLVYYLRAGDICNDILELTLGPERKDGLAIKFRGRRKNRSSGGNGYEFLVEGVNRL